MMVKVIYGVNFIAMFLIAHYEYNSDNDKTIIISSLAFVALFGLNLLFGFFAQLDKKAIYRHYYYAAFGLLFSVVILLSIW